MCNNHQSRRKLTQYAYPLWTRGSAEIRNSARSQVLVRQHPDTEQGNSQERRALCCVSAEALVHRSLSCSLSTFCSFSNSCRWRNLRVLEARAPSAASCGNASDGAHAAMYDRTVSTNCGSGSFRTPGRLPALAVFCPLGASYVSGPALLGGEWCGTAAKAIATLNCSCFHAAPSRRSLLRFAADVPTQSTSINC